MNLRKELKSSAQGTLKGNFVAFVGAGIVWALIMAWERGGKGK